MDFTKDDLNKELINGDYEQSGKNLAKLLYDIDMYDQALSDKDLIDGLVASLKAAGTLVPGKNGGWTIKGAKIIIDESYEDIIRATLRKLEIQAAGELLNPNFDANAYMLQISKYKNDVGSYIIDLSIANEIYDNVIKNVSGNNNESNSKNIFEIIYDWFKNLFSGFETSKSDPLVIDLDKNGFTAINAEEGVYFNLDSNGFAEKTAWTTEAFLAMDKNGNGTIDDGSELFSDTMIKSDGTRAVDGFDALADLDENGDGVIDSNDSAFSKLLLWQDKNGNGIAAPDELSTLAENGIISIDISNINENGETINDDVVLEKSAIINFSDGSSTTIGEFMFGKNGYDTMEEKLEITDAEILALPNVKQIGNIPSLHNAMAIDETGTVKRLLNEFISSNDMSQKEAITESLLMFLCNADNVTENNDFVDSKHLKVLEYIFGGEYDGVYNEHSGSSLEGIYKEVVNVYYNVINVQSCLKDWLDKWSEMTAREFFKFISEEISSNPSDTYKLGELARYLKFAASNNDYSLLNSYFAYFADLSDEYARAITSGCQMGQGTTENDNITGDEFGNVIFGDKGNDSLYGNEGNDVISGGEGNDSIHGGSGNDEIYGDEGSDIIDGGIGDDVLYGGAGNDTYIFKKGYGTDTIWDFEGSNIIKFGNDITKNDVILSVENNNLVISIVGTDDKLILGDFLASENYKAFSLFFSNGDYLDYQTDPEFFNKIFGTDSADYMSGILTDTAVELHGMGGDDALYGSHKNDVLDGGTGDDLLSGGNGDDTYIFGKGYGNDIIEDDAGNNIVNFKDINSDDITVSLIDYSSLEITVISTGDKLTINGFMWRQAEFEFKFADGEVGIFNKETGMFELISQSSDIVQNNADVLDELYSGENTLSDLLAENDNTVISEITDCASETENIDNASSLIDVQVMVLTENMAAFSNESNISDSMNMQNATDDYMLANQLLIGNQAS